MLHAGLELYSRWGGEGKNSGRGAVGEEGKGIAGRFTGLLGADVH